MTILTVFPHMTEEMRKFSAISLSHVCVTLGLNPRPLTFSHARQMLCHPSHCSLFYNIINLNPEGSVLKTWWLPQGLTSKFPQIDKLTLTYEYGGHIQSIAAVLEPSCGIFHWKIQEWLRSFSCLWINRQRMKLLYWLEWLILITKENWTATTQWI
jgi:hypothetical protein